MSRRVSLAFDAQCRALKLPVPVPEFRFAPSRRWRFDWAFPEQRIAVEQEGGVWTAGRHTRGSGYLGDMEKYNTAVRLGWRVLRFTPQQIRDGVAATAVAELLEADAGRAVMRKALRQV